MPRRVKFNPNLFIYSRREFILSDGQTRRPLPCPQTRPMDLVYGHKALEVPATFRAYHYMQLTVRNILLHENHLILLTNT
jgi:hypothetical protein